MRLVFFGNSARWAFLFHDANTHWNLSTLLEEKGDVKGAIASTEGYIAAGNPDYDGEQHLERLKKKLET